MCFFGRSDDIKPGTGPPPVKPRMDHDTTLPTATELVKEDQVADVQYGATKKGSGQAAANRAGADSLRINLNTGSQGGSGINSGNGGQMV